MKNQKTYMLKLIILLIFIILNFASNAQIPVKSISVGQNIPDVETHTILNYPTTKAKISDFKGKLLILDFWATYCAPCVGMFPKTDSLQKVFNGMVQFLSITKEPKSKVEVFLKNMFNVRHISPLTIVNDTLFSQLFPFSTIPYYVWIDKNGKVIAMTGAEDVTASNIEAALNGEVTTFANRDDVRKRNIDIKKSLFLLSYNFTIKDSLNKKDEVRKSDILSYSIATKYVENVTNGQLVFDMDHFAAYNTSIDFLYRFFYDAGYYEAPVRGAFDSKSTHVFEVSDSLTNRITNPRESLQGTKQITEWARNNAVCYEIYYPKGLSWKEKMELVKNDLDRYFAKPMGFSVHVEKRIDSNINVLRRIDNKIVLSTTGGEAIEHHDRYSYNQHNYTFTELINILNDYFFQNKKVSFIDKSGYGRVDIQLNCDMSNINSINEALNKYGLKFDVEPSKTNVLVFSDSK